VKISVVIPIYNGARTIEQLVDEVIKNLNHAGLEIILVNDGSENNTHAACVSAFNKYKGLVKYLRLAKNFGEHNTVLAGLNYATGDYAVIIDDDFQNPPAEIQKLIHEAISGKFDVVYSYYDKKQCPWYRDIGSKFNNLVATYLLNKPRDLYLSSFKCLDRFVINEVIKYKGPFPYIDGLVLRTTRNIGKVLVQHAKTRNAKSRYNLKKLLQLWLNMFVNFSVYPLRFSTFLGFLFSTLGGFLAIAIIGEKIIHPEIPQGVSSILVSILVFSGVQLIILGLIGEYIGKQFLTINRTPQYIVREALLENMKDITA
jgi:undecaprenyl-phosphate 4-deoxy-4-formamido-L-arabinose transferase